MPVLKVQTNAKIEDKSKFMSDATSLLSEVLHKPASYIMIIIEPETEMLFGGSDAPLAYVELKSIGLPGNETANLSAELCSFIEERTGISKNRIYIEFADAKRNMFGWNGGTF